MKKLVIVFLFLFGLFVSCGAQPSAKADAELYISLATAALKANEFGYAIKAVDKAIEVNKDSPDEYLLLSAKAKANQGELKEALKIYDKLYKKDVQFDPESLHIYMRLLANFKQYKESEIIFRKLIETKVYFDSLGGFGFALYKELGELDTAALYLFWNYEAGSPYTTPEQDTEVVDFFKDLEKSNKKNQNLLKVLDLIYAAMDSKIPENATYALDEKLNDSFIAQYARLKIAILREKNVTEDTIESLVALKPYFSTFSSYYWTVWNAIKLVYPKTQTEYISVLKAVIQSEPNGKFAHLARLEALELYKLDPSKINLADQLLF